MGSLRINDYRLKQLENVTDKFYLDSGEDILPCTHDSVIKYLS